MKAAAVSQALTVAFDAEDGWAQRINGAWRKSVEPIIETGRLIAEAKAAKILTPQPVAFFKTGQRLSSTPTTGATPA